MPTLVARKCSPFRSPESAAGTFFLCRAFGSGNNEDNAVDRLFTAIASKVSGAAGRPLTFIIAIALIVIWGVSGPLFHWSDTWQLVINTGTTIVTFLMVFLIQNSQNRDAAAMQSKLDELLRALEDARADFIGIEHLTDSEIEKMREDLEGEVGCEHGKSATRPETVKELLDRY